MQHILHMKLKADLCPSLAQFLQEVPDPQWIYPLKPPPLASIYCQASASCGNSSSQKQIIGIAAAYNAEKN